MGTNLDKPLLRYPQLECDYNLKINRMNRSLNSTEVLSKHHSHNRLGRSGTKLVKSVIHTRSPTSRPVSKPASHKAPLKDIAITSSLHETLISKNMKLNTMIRNIHSFAVCLEDLDWVVHEAESIMRGFIEKMGKPKRTAHRIQIENIHSEMVKLVNRLQQLEKGDLRHIANFHRSSKVLTENVNLMNIHHQQDTIGSFKCTDIDNTENEEDSMPADFSKIKLPSLIKETAAFPNIENSRFEQELKIKQFQSTIQVLKDEAEREKQASEQTNHRYQAQIAALQTQLQKNSLDWHSYRNYASATIRKCKEHLQQLTVLHGEQPEEIERLLDDLFSWENSIDGNIIEDSSSLSERKKELLSELLDLEWRVKEGRAEVERMQTNRSKSTSRYNWSKQRKEVECPEQDLVKMLFVQASTIEHLI